jgi:hypothetical protein
MENFNEPDELDAILPPSLKKELLSEVDNIRDTLNIANLFLGGLMLTGLKMMQTEDKQNT